MKLEQIMARQCDEPETRCMILKSAGHADLGGNYPSRFGDPLILQGQKESYSEMTTLIGSQESWADIYADWDDKLH